MADGGDKTGDFPAMIAEGKALVLQQPRSGERTAYRPLMSLCSHAFVWAWRVNPHDSSKAQTAAKRISQGRQESATPPKSQPHPLPSPSRRHSDPGAPPGDARRRLLRIHRLTRAGRHNPDRPIAPAWRS